jgi:threonine/homoserine/homoserine lactone efflux protein
MIPVETMSAFFVASLCLALAPGPDNLFVLTQSALSGRGAGLVVMLGLCTGLVFHTAGVALGVAIIFRTSAIAFSVLKILGAAYLLYLAWQAFHASTVQIHDAGSSAPGFWKLYRRGIIMNVTNPKVSIFFLAFLPQFADPFRGPISLQMMLLGGVFIISTVLVFGGIALLAGTLGQWLNRSSRTQKYLNNMACVVFVGLALKLAAAKM